MNDAHLHLLFNHLPIIIPFVGLVVLIAGIILKLELVKRTAFGIVVMGAILTVPAGSTGESAEHYLEEHFEVDHHSIHEHEEAAELFAVLSYISGIIAAFAFWASYKEKAFSKFLPIVLLLMLLGVLFTSYGTGVTGGEIMHMELKE